MPENVGDAVLTLRTDDAQFRRGVDAAGRQAQRLDTTLRQAATGSTNLGARLATTGRQAQTAGRMMNGLRGNMGQLGFQIQDIAVQLQAGTSPFIVMAQQGSQIASIFGPGGPIVGALIAVGSIAAGTLLGMARDSVETAEEASHLAKALEGVNQMLAEMRDLARELDLQDIAEDFARLTAEGQRLQLSLGGLVLQKTRQDIKDTEAEFLELARTFSAKSKSMAMDLEGIGIDRGPPQRLIENLDRVTDAFERGEANVSQLQDAIGALEGTFPGAANEALNIALKLEKNRKEASDAADAYGAMHQATVDLSAFGGIGPMIDDETDSLKDQNAALRDNTKLRTELPPLEEPRVSTPAETFSERLAGRKDFIVGEEFQEPRLSQETIEAMNKADEAALREQDQLKSLSVAFDEYAASVRNAQGPLTSLIGIYDQLSKTQQEHAASQQENLAGTVAFSETALRDLFGKNQAFALADAVVNTALAVTKALAAAPPPANYALAAAVSALGAAQIGVIAAQGFAQGGSFGAGQPLIAGEYGRELIVPEVGGQVFSAADTRSMLSGTGGGPTVFIDARGADREGMEQLRRFVEQVNGSIEERSVAAVVSKRARDPNLFRVRR